jgi:hypothetical protein
MNGTCQGIVTDSRDEDVVADSEKPEHANKQVITFTIEINCTLENPDREPRTVALHNHFQNVITELYCISF